MHVEAAFVKVYTFSPSVLCHHLCAAVDVLYSFIRSVYTYINCFFFSGFHFFFFPFFYWRHIQIWQKSGWTFPMYMCYFVLF